MLSRVLAGNANKQWIGVCGPQLGHGLANGGLAHRQQLGRARDIALLPDHFKHGLLLRHSLERRLCDEAHLNLAYRWFCHLSLEDEVPNPSTYSRNRRGRSRDSSLFRWLFNEVLRRCMDAGLVKGEGFAVDASVMRRTPLGSEAYPATKRSTGATVAEYSRRA